MRFLGLYREVIPMTYRSNERTLFATERSSGRYFCDIINSSNSPRVRGRIVFRQNALSQRKGQGTTSPFFAYRATKTSPISYHSVMISPGIGFNYAKAGPPYFGGYSSIDVNERRIVEDKLRSKISAEVVNLADMWRTRRETVSMITSTVSRIAHSYSALRKGKVRDSLAHLGITYRRKRHKHLNKMSAPDAWLELQYGWKPLLGDVHSLATSTWDVVQGIVRAQHSSYREEPLASYDQIQVSGTIAVTSTYKSRVKVTFQGSAMSAAARLGLLNPATLAWEALPFSFIVDWFLPIGDWLESFTSFSGVTLSDYSLTFKTKVEYDIYADYSPFIRIHNYIPVSSLSQRCNGSDVFKTRLLTTLPVREYPRFKNPLSTGHFANAMSLLASAFDRPHRRQ